MNKAEEHRQTGNLADVAHRVQHSKTYKDVNEEHQPGGVDERHSALQIPPNTSTYLSLPYLCVNVLTSTQNLESMYPSFLKSCDSFLLELH